MENIKQMQDRHAREIKELQEECLCNNHQRLPYMWAPGHFGNDVEMCNDCGKILKTYDSSTILGDDIILSVNNGV